MERVNTYVELMEQFLKLPGNNEFHQLFRLLRRICGSLPSNLRGSDALVF